MSFDVNKPVQTRDGRKARIICTDAKGNRPIVALAERNSGDEYASWHGSNGRWWPSGDETGDDLINIPEKRWAVIYEIEEEGYGVLVTTHEEILTDVKRTAGAIACLEFTEGDGL